MKSLVSKVILVALQLSLATLIMGSYSKGCNPEPAEVLGCDYYGKTFEIGEEFPSYDRCNTCTCTEDGIPCTKMACLCSGDEWFMNYVENDVEACAAIHFYCSPNMYYFSNDCGCGCQQAPWCEEYYDCEYPTDCSFEIEHCPLSNFGL
jgi:hypothetical protein